MPVKIHPAALTMFHSLFGITFMLLGRFLPAPSMIIPVSESTKTLGLPVVEGGLLLSITPEGMTVVTLFLGVIYLWTFVDTLWPSFLGVLLLGMSTYAPMPQVLSQYFGNPMVVMIFFLFMFAAVLIKSNLSAYVARWFMTHPFVQGRPWRFTASILLATYIVAFFEQTTACFLMWPALYIIFKHAGFQKGDRYVTVMIVNTMIMALLSFATDPIKGGAFYLLANMQNLAAQSADLHVVPLDFATYLFFGILISLACIATILCTMRFILRVDVSPLGNLCMEDMDKTSLPPLSLQQKILVALFLFYATWLLLPGIIGRENPLGSFLAQNAFGGTLLVIFLVSFLRVQGKPLANLIETNAAYPWRTFFLIATAFLLGGVMSGKGTNVSLFMEYFLRQHLSGLGATALTIAVILLGIVITNFFNSVVAGLLLSPVLLAIANGFGFSAGPVLACFFYIVLIAAATPAGSPFAAILYDNTEWVSKKDVAIHTSLSSAIVVIVMIVLGIPLSKVLF